MPLPARLVLAALAGVGAAASFEPLHWVYLLPVTVAVLTAACTGTRAGRGVLVGAVFGVAFMLALLPWLHVIGVAAWLVLAVVEGLYYGLLGWGTVLVTRLPWWPLWTACLWVGVELLRSSVPFGGFPWGRLAFAVTDTPLAPLTGYVGAAGVTFAVALVGTSLAWAAYRVRTAPLRAVGAVAAVAALASLAAVFPVPAPAADAPRVTVAAVQGNVPGEGLEAFAEQRVVLENHVAATFELAQRIKNRQARLPDLMLWPENSSDIDPYTDDSAHAAISAAVREVGAPLLMGAVVGDRAHDGWRNRAIVWSARGRPVAHYDKRHPVPFGEYIPFRSFFAPRIPALSQIPSDMIPGHRPGVLQVGPARVGVLMCFEVAYDGLLRDLVDEGARLVVVPTNNATYTGTGQIEQQFAISRLRAIETGRYVVVASTNGISGIIAPDGRVVARAPVRTQAVLEQPVTLSAAVTPAVRWGGRVEWALTVAGIVAVLAGLLLSGRARTRGTAAAPAGPDRRAERVEPAVRAS
ncbi:MAG TPA: apolipoprotein N-acyltransferase [Nocardioidaceae bacterium]